MPDERAVDARIAENVFGYVSHPIDWLNKEQRVLAPPGMVVGPDNFEWGQSIYKFVPHYSTDPAASKQLREKLAETWDWTLGHATNFAMALWPKGTIDKYSTPTYLGVSDTEELAVTNCVEKMLELGK